MKTTTIFIIIVLTLSNYINAQKSDTAFEKIKGALENFLGSIQKEAIEIKTREKKSQEWCKNNIDKAQATLTARTKDVNDVKEHVKFLQNEIKETTTDKTHRSNQVTENEKTLNRFKKERCDNNLNYIKSLREHKTSIDIMKLLRQDLVTYFDDVIKNPKKAKNLSAGSFIEKMSRFAHLFDEEHRNIFIQLVESIKSLNKSLRTEAEVTGDLDKETDSYTKTQERSSASIGTGHVDNAQGELRKLEAPGVVKAREYVIQLKSKTLAMIDSLIKHLEESRKKLSEDEMLANEHFADFQAQLIKENIYLGEKIEEDVKILLTLNVQLIESKGQEQRREVLRAEAEENLKALRKQCNEKSEYFKKENSRILVELITAKNAITIYNGLMAKIQARLTSRVSANFAGAKSYSDKDINEKEVAGYHQGVHANIASNIKTRSEVAY